MSARMVSPTLILIAFTPAAAWPAAMRDMVSGWSMPITGPMTGTRSAKRPPSSVATGTPSARACRSWSATLTAALVHGRPLSSPSTRMVALVRSPTPSPVKAGATYRRIAPWISSENSSGLPGGAETTSATPSSPSTSVRIRSRTETCSRVPPSEILKSRAPRMLTGTASTAMIFANSFTGLLRAYRACACRRLPVPPGTS